MSFLKSFKHGLLVICFIFISTRALSISILVDGDLTLLPVLAEAHLTGDRPVIFFSKYLKYYEISKLLPKVDFIIFTTNGKLQNIVYKNLKSVNKKTAILFLVNAEKRPLLISISKGKNSFVISNRKGETLKQKIFNLEKYRSHSIEMRYMKINPTRYKVSVKLKFNEPFWLVLSETFHPAWKARIRKSYTPLQPEPRWSLEQWWNDRSKIIKIINDHFLANGFANAWWINPNGIGQQFDIIIEFTWQRYFEGILLSAIILILFISILLIWRSKIKKSSS